jgi:archaellum biogenesis ATPase FlaH
MNNIKRVVFMACLLAGMAINGQHRPDGDKIKALKVAFLTEKLNLSSKEAQSFWPVYNEYEQEREALRQKERVQIREKIRNADALSEKEASDLLSQYISFEEEEEVLEQNFLKKMVKLISAKKTLVLLRSEEEFKRQLIRQYRQKNGGRP